MLLRPCAGKIGAALCVFMIVAFCISGPVRRMLRLQEQL